MKLNDYISNRRKRNRSFDDGYEDGRELFMLGQALAMAREDSGWSQKLLAEKAGVSTWAIGKIEKNTAKANIGEIAAVAKCLQPWLSKYGYGENNPLFGPVRKEYDRVTRGSVAPSRIAKTTVHH